MRTVVTAVLALAMGAAWADSASPNAALARMPVKEITVFKDGNSYVLREGALPTDAAGDVLMDDLPTPVLGTFWVYSTDPKARVASVSARQRRVLIERTALTIPQMIEANPGVEVGVSVSDEYRFTGRIVGVPTRSAEELQRTNPPNAGERLPEKAGVAVFQSAEGSTVTPLDRIRDITFKGAMNKALAAEEFRNLLTVRLDAQSRKPNATANLGMIYVQRGVRWLPSYKVTLDGKGNAAVALQATIVNDEADLDNVTMNLVIGVPSFAFDKTPDPMSLQQTFAQAVAAMDRYNASAYGLSNAIMAQAPAAYAGGFGGISYDRSAEPTPEVAGSERNEDLFVFTVKNVSVRKGERVVVPISQRTVKYRDVYTLLLPYGPPRDLQQGFATAQQARLARALASPKVQHIIRLTNGKDEPLTTAPALILSGPKVLGQGMMTYTPMGGDQDLEITSAVDVTVKSSEKETGRTMNAITWRGNSLSRVDLSGAIALKNHRDKAVDLEVVRYVLGEVDSADHGGEVEKVGAFDQDATSANIRPDWWGYYNWPGWWNNVNGVGRVTWKLSLPAEQSLTLGYQWHYFWE